MSRSWNNRVQRDVKMVFNLFVESLQGGTPGQSYIVNYQRGGKEKGSSEPVTANAQGVADFKFHRNFLSTLQRKNDTSYKKKEFRLYVSESPGGFVVLDLVYDLAGPVENEVFPNKNLMVKSPNGTAKLLFSISGISEEEHLKYNPGGSSMLREQSTSSFTTDRQASSSAFRAENSMQQAPRNATSAVAVSVSQPASSVARQASPPTSGGVTNYEDDDDDLGELVNEVVAQVSGRKGVSVASDGYEAPKGTQRSTSPAPRATDSTGKSTGVQQQSVVPQQRPPPVESAQVPAPPVAPASPSAGANASTTIVASAPPSSINRSVPQPNNANSSQPSTAVPVREATASPSPVPAETSAPSSKSHRVSKQVAADSEDRESIDRQTTVSAVVAATRVDKEVEKYLFEISSAVLAIADQAARAGGGGTTATVSTGKHTFNFMTGTKTASSIPKAALLVLHCIKHWSGAKRIYFLHDFIAMLFVEVIPSTRHAAQWMNVLLHVLYHNLTQSTDEEVEAYYDPLDDTTAIQIADDFMQCVSDAEECGYGSRNTFMVRGSRTDALSQILPKELDVSTTDGSVPSTPPPLSPTLNIVLTIAIDEALRRLSDAAAVTCFEDIQRFCFPPKNPPTRHTINGYQLASQSASHTAQPIFVSGGGPDHPTEDAAFSVVLHALNRLYNGLFGVSKDHPQGASPLLRLVGAEMFKITFRNINNLLINRLFVAAKNGSWESRIRTVRAAMNFKLALSMFEGWMQEHQLFIAARGELLACRQVCDLIILQKRLLKNVDLCDEVTSQLHPQLIYLLLEQYQPDLKEYAVDDVPKDVLAAFKIAADEKLKAAGRSKHEKPQTEAPFPQLATRSLSSFGYLDFVSQLVPQEGEDPNQHRKSMRASISAASKVKASFAPVPSEYSASEERALNWDHVEDKLTVLRNRESVLSLSTTHDATGRPLDDSEREEAQKRIALRLAALSIADDEVIRRMVV